MNDLAKVATALSECGLPHMPPLVVVTRWHALLAGETVTYLDAAWEANNDIPGTRYTLLAATSSAVCYLRAEHDNEDWSYDPAVANFSRSDGTPRTVKSWRRPLTAVTEVRLGGDDRRWALSPGRNEPPAPAYVLVFAGDTVEVPLPYRHRQGPEPDVASLVRRFTQAWSLSGL